MPTDTTAEPVVATGAETTAVETPTEWDGDFSTLDKQPWWESIPEGARTKLSSTHEELTKATERASYLDRLFQSDDAVTALRADLEAKTAELDGLKKSLGDVTAERDKLRTDHTTASERLAEIEADREFDRLEAKYPDIFKDVYYKDEAKTELEQKGAFMLFMELREKGFDEERAARLARAELPAGGTPAAPAAAPAAPVRPAPRDVKVPPSVAAATPGGNAPSRTVKYERDEDIDVVMAKAKRAAAEEDGLLR